MYNLWVFKDPGLSAVMRSAVPLRYQDEWRDDEPGVAFAQAAIDRYYRDGSDLFQIPGLSEYSQFFVLLRAKNSGRAGSSGVCSGEEEVSDAVVAEEAGEEDRDLDEVTTAAEADRSGLQRQFHELQT